MGTFTQGSELSLFTLGCYLSPFQGCPDMEFSPDNSNLKF
jgi:hypothetical protein